MMMKAMTTSRFMRWLPELRVALQLRTPAPAFSQGDVPAATAVADAETTVGTKRGLEGKRVNKDGKSQRR